jgi:hypothetical protein
MARTLGRTLGMTPARTLALTLAMTLALTACASNVPDNAVVCRASAASASHVEVVARGIVTQTLGSSNGALGSSNGVVGSSNGAVGSSNGVAGTHEGLMMRLNSGCGLTVRVEINTDFTGEIRVRPGQSITVKGEYETDPDGGVIHWTHRDPRGHHADGFVRVGLRASTGSA